MSTPAAKAPAKAVKEKIVSGVVWFPAGPLKHATAYRMSGPMTWTRFRETVGEAAVSIGWQEGSAISSQNASFWDSEDSPGVEWRPAQKGRGPQK